MVDEIGKSAQHTWMLEYLGLENRLSSPELHQVFFVLGRKNSSYQLKFNILMVLWVEV